MAMTSIGLREARRHASEYVRRAEGGERITVTVAGRPAAELVPVGEPEWTSYERALHALSRPRLEPWDRDEAEEIVEPWAER
jgi:prevent-host-death family protein